MRELPLPTDRVPAERIEQGDIAVTRRRLAAAFGARRLVVDLIEVDPGRRSAPPYALADQDEACLVLAGGGLARLGNRAYAIGADDMLFHPAGGDAHALIAGAVGLTALVVAEDCRRYAADLARAGEPGPLPPPERERPPTIRNLADLPMLEGRDGVIAYAVRGIHDIGAERIVLAQDALPAGTHNTALHFHSAREEAWYVRSGSGVARLGADGHELRPGSFWLVRENTGVGHRIEVGPDGMELVTIGDMIPGDVCVYTEKRTFRPARGVELPY